MGKALRRFTAEVFPAVFTIFGDPAATTTLEDAERCYWMTKGYPQAIRALIEIRNYS
jgi:hypothetical protein